MRTFYKVFFKFLKSYDLIEKWSVSVKSHYNFRRTSKTLVSSLISYLDADLLQEKCNKFYHKVCKFAHKNNITFVNIFNVYDYVLKHSEFRDNPDYNITQGMSIEDYINDFVRNMPNFQIIREYEEV